MLRQLRIKNLALIDDLNIEFAPGFTIFTGETGAGKSILAGAIGLLLGDRASADSIRSGSDEAEIGGVFELVRLSKDLAGLLSDNGIAADDNTLIFRRAIARNGRNRVWINQVPVPLATLKACGDMLVDFHSQHEHQSLLRPDAPRMLVDSLAPAQDAWKSYAESFARYEAVRTELDALEKKAAERAAQRDLLEFQYNELAGLELRPGEEQAVEEELRAISTLSERLAGARAIAELIESPGTDPLDRRLAAVKKHLEQLAKCDAAAKPWVTEASQALSFVTELERFATSYLKNAETGADPGRLDFLNARLAKIQRLKKKHGCSFDDLLQKQQRLKQELDSIENIDSDRAELKRLLDETRQACMKSGAVLSNARRRASVELDAAVTQSMARLGFTGGAWKTVFSAEPDLTAHGLEELSFEVRTNPGEPFLPLAKTASGGEISRLMLAVKTFVADKDRIPVLIFDEIDTGIGGMLAAEVGAALKRLSSSHQLLCISHLHQIASMADTHILVYKKMEDGRTVTRVKTLSAEEQVEEISRMLGGKSDSAMRHARELVRGKSKR